MLVLLLLSTIIYYCCLGICFVSCFLVDTHMRGASGWYTSGHGLCFSHNRKCIRNFIRFGLVIRRYMLLFSQLYVIVMPLFIIIC